MPKFSSRLSQRTDATSTLSPSKLSALVQAAKNKRAASSRDDNRARELKACMASESRTRCALQPMQPFRSMHFSRICLNSPRHSFLPFIGKADARARLVAGSAAGQS